MNRTAIEYLKYTWSPVTGCGPPDFSPGCNHCYARRLAEGRLRGRAGYPKDEPFQVTLHPERFDQPLRVKKSARIGACFMGDLWHEDVPTNKIHRILSTGHYGPRHTFLFLTKRPHRILQEFNHPSLWTKNFWLGATVENQEKADERIPVLLQIPAAVRWVSYEPALGPLELEETLKCPRCNGEGFIDNEPYPCPRCHTGGVDGTYLQHLDWVVCGPETGPRARPMNLDWARQVRDDCVNAGVPFWFKDGELDGKTWNQLPGEKP